MAKHKRWKQTRQSAAAAEGVELGSGGRMYVAAMRDAQDCSRWETRAGLQLEEAAPPCAAERCGEGDDDAATSRLVEGNCARIRAARVSGCDVRDRGAITRGTRCAGAATPICEESGKGDVGKVELGMHSHRGEAAAHSEVDRKLLPPTRAAPTRISLSPSSAPAPPLDLRDLGTQMSGYSKNERLEDTYFVESGGLRDSDGASSTGVECFSSPGPSPGGERNSMAIPRTSPPARSSGTLPPAPGICGSAVRLWAAPLSLRTRPAVGTGMDRSARVQREPHRPSWTCGAAGRQGGASAFHVGQDCRGKVGKVLTAMSLKSVLGPLPLRFLVQSKETWTRARDQRTFVAILERRRWMRPKREEGEGGEWKRSRGSPRAPSSSGPSILLPLFALSRGMESV
ncbi:hypothetical protein K438DRAFT_1752532 [Mycena galopus ATCC 62051]|nr:hypothetical protein K438DRAFT_1752532 [Mycena galopus ATCC 62051]